MRGCVRPLAALLLAAVAAIAIAACGSSSKSSSSSSSGGAGGSSTPSPAGSTVNMVQGTFPDSLDPGFGYVTQGEETNWLVYTGLTTYAHKSGTAGATLIPGLATALPVISDGGKTYTATLRRGLKYSNGQPVRASDFRYAIERAVRIPWGGSGAFMTPVIVGASAFANKKATTISGVQADDATGKITIHLTAPYGAFDNVLAEPAAGLVPSGSRPLKNDPSNPPPGVGPYMVKNINIGSSYSVVKNPDWTPIPGIPSGKVNIDVKVSSNISSNAEAVLNNTADIFDWADTIPGSLIPQINAKAADRFKLINLGNSTYYFFMNTQVKPFSDQLAREAVVTGLNEAAYSREGSGTLAPACFFLPPSIPGHPTNATCPYGTPGTGNLARAKALVKQSGMAGQKVTVWSQTKSPRQQWATTYAQYLNQIGFKATLKVLADSTYFATVGELKLHPQTGFADWVQDFPNPVDFYGPLLNGKAILKNNNENYGEVNDPHVNQQIATLGTTPSTQLQKNDAAWQKLDEYVAKKAYLGVFGYQKYPFFASDRMNYGALVESPIYGWDFTSFELK